jgi:DNA-binding NtrC family response regulator
VPLKPVQRIFVVDDEPVIASTLAIIFNTSGYSARWFTRATEALTAAQSDSPDLLISDVAMPGLSGVDLAIQMTARFPKCKILLFSGHATTSDLLKNARDQGHDFLLLPKPVHPIELLSQIGTMVQGEHNFESTAQAKAPAPKKLPKSAGLDADEMEGQRTERWKAATK